MDLWNTQTAIINIPGHNIEVPTWLDQAISPYEVAGIVQLGCASGAYMPAVTYSKALRIMGEHGDDVLEYIENNLGKLPDQPKSESWSGLACFYLSCAVELWASNAESELSALDFAD